MVDSYSSWHAVMGRDREPGASANAGGSHWQNFIDAVRARDSKVLNCDIEEGHKSATLNHLANISYRLGRTLEFDPGTEMFVDDDEANAMISRNYRSPFVVPEGV